MWTARWAAVLGGKMKKITILAFMALLFISCTSTYKYDFNNPSNEILEKNKEIAVSVSEDSFYGSDIYNGSGRIRFANN